MYLDILAKYKVTPNFWCSEEYWEKAGWREVRYGKHTDPLFNIQDSEGVPMLPTVDKFGNLSGPYWAGFSDEDLHMNQGKFLDYEFSYRPICDPAILPGKKWKTTRKNIHKVLKEHGKLQIIDINDLPAKQRNLGLSPSRIADMLEEWTGEGEINILHDPEVMMSFLLEGDHRCCLKIGLEIVGLIVWDENWMRVNFRYCLVKPYPGLSDYARVMFRHYMYQLRPAKLINDGGSLDRESLYEYKMRMNPWRVKEIYGTL